MKSACAANSSSVSNGLTFSRVPTPTSPRRRGVYLRVPVIDVGRLPNGLFITPPPFRTAARCACVAHRLRRHQVDMFSGFHRSSSSLTLRDGYCVAALGVEPSSRTLVGFRFCEKHRASDWKDGSVAVPTPWCWCRRRCAGGAPGYRRHGLRNQYSVIARVLSSYSLTLCRAW